MPTPNLSELTLPTLKAVSLGDGTSEDVRNKIAADLELSADDLSEKLPSGTQSRFINRVAWALVCLRFAGLIRKVQRGVYQLTEEGRKVLTNPPPQIDRAFLMRYSGYAEWQKRSPTTAVIPDASAASASDNKLSPIEQIGDYHSQLRVALEVELLARIREASPSFFEKLVLDLLEHMGYGTGKVTGRSGDGGVDGYVNPDKLGLDRIPFQAKRYQVENSIGSRIVREFAGALGAQKANKGILVTTSHFTKDGLAAAKEHNLTINLIDGRKLAELLVEHGVGVRETQTIVIKKMDEDYFVE